ncbi:glycosyltransferase family 2 protein [Flavobacterium sp. ST-87]|uniref:Glycosyltransferase family 2 protein n=1 Tax=Flavobacterium plantiphilum TaxID=3163297 RepID=A0ABW8XT20_9FLAO
MQKEDVLISNNTDSINITIITINYNNNEGLRKTIESVVNQDSQNFEYIVIDGGSTDGSRETIEKFSKKIDYWVSEKDSGIYNAMNKGIKIAKGDFILFLNSGDWLFEESTLSKVNLLINNKSDIFYCNTIFKYDKKDVIVKYDKKISFKFFIEDNFCHQATFIRKKLFYDIFFYNEKLKIASDWEFFIYAICIKNVSHQYLDIVVSNYDLRGISSRPEFRDLSLGERQQVLNTHFPMFISDLEMSPQLKDKRIPQLLHIKKFKLAWKILKGFINFLLFFLPKQGHKKS